VLINKPNGYPKISVVMCTLNEEKNLPYVLPKIPQWVDEVILVDGQSADNTVMVAQQLCPGIKVFLQQDKGKGNAMRFGIQQATGEIVVMLDADGSTDPTQIESFIEPLLNGYDFAKGSRFLGGQLKMPFLRRFGNCFFTILANIMYGTHYTDFCAGFNVFWKSIPSQLDPTGTSFLDEPTLNIRLKKRGFKVKEVSQRDNGRIVGKANENLFPQGWRIFKIIISERFRE